MLLGSFLSNYHSKKYHQIIVFTLSNFTGNHKNSQYLSDMFANFEGVDVNFIGDQDNFCGNDKYSINRESIDTIDINHFDLDVAPKNDLDGELKNGDGIDINYFHDNDYDFFVY